MTQSRKLESPSTTISQAYSQHSPISTKRIAALLSRSKSMPQLQCTTPYLYKTKDISRSSRPIDYGGESSIYIGSSTVIRGDFVIKCLTCADEANEKTNIKTSDSKQIKTKQQCDMEKDLWIKLTEAKARNILQFHGYYYTKKNFYFIFSKEEQSLSAYIDKQNTPSWQLRYRLMIDITEGIVDIHKNGIIHGDIKGGNILVNAKMQHPKICDFGSAHEETDCRRRPLTIEYAAAELFEKTDTPTTKHSDIFSLAVTFWQIATWKVVPWDDIPQYAIKSVIQAGITLRLPKYIPAKISNLITMCWSQVPSSRPTAVQVLDELNLISIDELNEADENENQYRLCENAVAENIEEVRPKM